MPSFPLTGTSSSSRSRRVEALASRSPRGYLQHSSTAGFRPRSLPGVCTCACPGEFEWRQVAPQPSLVGSLALRSLQSGSSRWRCIPGPVGLGSSRTQAAPPSIHRKGDPRCSRLLIADGRAQVPEEDGATCLSKFAEGYCPCPSATGAGLCPPPPARDHPVAPSAAPYRAATGRPTLGRRNANEEEPRIGHLA
jgi:hypothetical protein